jgi:hypothetical protein
MQVTNSSSTLFASWEGADSQAAAPQQDLAAGAAGQDTAPGFPGTLVGYNKPLLVDDSPILTAGHTKPLQVSNDALTLVGHNKPLLLDTTAGTTAGSTATPPNADPMEIAALELLLAEPANRDMVQHFGGPLKPLPTGTDTGQGIQARYGADLGARLNQLQTAQQTVREEYHKAWENAAKGGGGPDQPGWLYTPEIKPQHADDSGVPARWDFDPVTFTQHYASGGSPAQKAFAQLHGSEPLYFKPSLQDYEIPGDYVRNGERGQYVLDDPLQPTFRLSATDDTELINKENLWFDPVHGWSTDEDNLKGDWIDKLSPVLMGGFLAFCTAGTLSSLMGPASSAAGSIAQSAAIGASSSAVIQLVTTGKLDFGNMLRSALTAGMATGIMDASGMGDMLKAQDLGTRMTAHLGKAGMQGVLQQAIGGKFKDGFANSLLSSAASEVGAHLDQQIKAQLPELDPAQASALKLLSRAATSALRIAGSNDPAASFANDFLMGALQDAAADRKPGQEGRDGHEGAQEGSTVSSGLGLKPPRDWVERLGRSEIADPSPEEAQAAFRQSERDYRNSTEHSVTGSSYVAQSGDSISRILGTSDPQAVGNFIRANGLTSSHVTTGRNYFVPDDANAYGDSAALGQAVLHGDNARLAALAQQRTAQQQARWDALQTGAWRGRTDTQGGPVWHGGAPARSTSATNSPHTGWWPALTGATTGVGQSLAHMGQGAVQAGADSLEQLGDILTFGANHDHPQMQEVWQRQRERGQALGRLASDPKGAATDMMESVAHRYEAANAITDNDYERSRRLGYLFNDVGQGLLGAGTALRGASRLGAAGGEVLGENAFNGPLAGGRAAQRGGVEVGANTGFTPATSTGLTFETKVTQQGPNLEIELTSNQKFDKATGAVVDNKFSRSNLVGALNSDGNLFIHWYETSVQGRGVGSEMISKAIETAGVQNVTSVSAQLGLTNAKAYEAAIASGANPINAVWQTPIGKTMQSMGYTNAVQTGTSYFKFSR